jgi:hypothetical protein
MSVLGAIEQFEGLTAEVIPLGVVVGEFVRDEKDDNAKGEIKV